MSVPRKALSHVKQVAESSPALRMRSSEGEAWNNILELRRGPVHDLLASLMGMGSWL